MFEIELKNNQMTTKGKRSAYIINLHILVSIKKLIISRFMEE